MRSMARRVASGDPDNLEAQAAQRYWVNLFGPTFRRDRDAEGINAVLNFGYAVIRASIARNIVASGLLPSLGVHHSNRGNPFCLADDLIEPYRPLVDKVVAGLDRQDSTMDLADRAVRSSILAILNKTTTINGRRVPVFLACAPLAYRCILLSILLIGLFCLKHCNRTMNQTTTSIPSGWRVMWIVAMFDIPTLTPEMRRAYTEFRKCLLKDGFSMAQYSVYIRPCPNEENADMHVRRLGQLVPAFGEVRFLTITDKQFARIRTFIGKQRFENEKPPKQLQLL